MDVSRNPTPATSVDAARTHAAAGAPAPPRPPRQSRRATLIRWLRTVHGWVGLWGAAAGLLLGISGFLLNHRAMMKLPTGTPVVSTVQLPLPQPAPDTPAALSDWIRAELGVSGRAGRVQREPARHVAWGERDVVQPEHWQLSFASPAARTEVDYWVGNGYATVKRTDDSALGMLKNLHKGTGLTAGWVLLLDTFAGALVALSLTGVLLWVSVHRRRVVGLVVVGTSIAALTAFALL